MDAEFKNKIESHLHRNDYYGATELIEEFLQSKEHKDHQNFISEIILLYVKQSRYKEALYWSYSLEEIQNVKNIPKSIKYFLGYLTCFAFIFDFKKILHLILKIVKKMYFRKNSSNDFSSYYAVLFGIYWQDMEKSLQSNLYCCATAGNKNEYLISLGFLGYTLALKGHQKIGISCLKKAIFDAKSEGAHAALNDLSVFLGVAYQFSAMPIECIGAHKVFNKEFPDAPPFAKLISSASLLNLNFTELGLLEASIEIEKAMQAAISLKDSRNHIQIYGVKACLLAFHNSTEDAFQFLTKARDITLKNVNSLDTIIYLRFEALFYFLSGNPSKSMDSIIHGQKTLSRYGQIDWYDQEFRRIQSVLEVSQNPAFTRRILVSVFFLFHSLRLFNWVKLKKGLRHIKILIFQEKVSYWTNKEQLLYWQNFSTESFKLQEDGFRAIKKISSIAELVLNYWSELSQMETGVKKLSAVLQKGFGNENVYYGTNKNEVYSMLKKDKLCESTFMINTESQYVCIPLRQSRIFVGLNRTENLNSGDQFFIGVIVPFLAEEVLSFLKLTLKLILSFFESEVKSIESKKIEFENRAKIKIAETASQVAHDIRSPLSALKVLVELSDTMPKDKRSLLKNASDRINDIANSLLIQSKLSGAIGENSKGLEVQKTNSNLELVLPLLDSIISEKRILIKSLNPKIKLELKFNHNDVDQFARIDATEFKRILSNLINNSIEAINETGNIIVHMFRDEDKYICIEVDDNGKGIEENKLNFVFDKGVSIDKVDGTGLGLYHAKSTIKMWNGELKIKSERGKGTRLTIKLPISLPPSWFDFELSTIDDQKYIIVDDDPSVHDLWKSKLNDSYFLGFNSTEEFINWVKTSKSSICNFRYLIDYEFLGEVKNGVDLIEYLNIPSQTRLVTTRYEEEQILEFCHRFECKIIPKNLIPFI